MRARSMVPWLLLAACATAGPVTPVRSPPAVAPAPVPVPVVVAPQLAIRFEPLLTPTPRLAVEITARGVRAPVWQFAAPIAAEARELQIRDDTGDLPLLQAREGQALVVRFLRAPVGTVAIRYVIHPTEVSEAGPDVPADLLLRIDSRRVLAAAEEVLLLPTTGEEVAVETTLVAAPPGLVRVASTLGAPGWKGTARLSELRHAAFLIGPLGQAEFRGPEGDDDFAWAGETSFDLRWSAAETAGARTAVDAYFKAGETRKFSGLLAVDVDFRGSGGMSVHPRGGGLYVAIAPGTQWDAKVRLAVAHGLVHRWIGGRLRLRGAEGEAPEVGLWFSAGFARAVAREVLLDLGTLSARDYAEEVNTHEAVVATAPLRAASNAEVAAAAAGGDADAHALLIARGVLYATRLAARLQARPERSLQLFLGELIAEAQKAGVAALPVEAFTRRIAADLGSSEVKAFTTGVLEGEPLMLPADALGPCFVRRPRTYTRFDLGFDEKATLEQTPPTIRGLRKGGPAARAGVREGDVLVTLSIDYQDMTEPAMLTLVRGGDDEVQVSYRPVGPPGRGDGWLRRPGVDERTCPL